MRRASFAGGGARVGSSAGGGRCLSVFVHFWVLCEGCVLVYMWVGGIRVRWVCIYRERGRRKEEMGGRRSLGDNLHHFCSCIELLQKLMIFPTREMA